jgi:hypothetical protein
MWSTDIDCDNDCSPSITISSPLAFQNIFFIVSKLIDDFASESLFSANANLILHYSWLRGAAIDIVYSRRLL